MDKTVLFNFTYGLYVLTTKTSVDNGCIVDAVMQLTDEPPRLAVCVNKEHLTNSMIKKSEIFTLSILSKKVKQEVISNFGYQSGREVNKFDTFSKIKRGDNGAYFITEDTNAYVECKVIDAYEYGSHTLFVADILDAVRLSEIEPITYSEYRKQIK